MYYLFQFNSNVNFALSFKIAILMILFQAKIHKEHDPEIVINLF